MHTWRCTHAFTHKNTAHTHTGAVTCREKRSCVCRIEWRERGGGCNGTLSFSTSGGSEGEQSWSNYWGLHGQTHTYMLHTQSRRPILSTLGKVGEHNHHYQIQGAQIFGVQKCKSQSLCRYSNSSSRHTHTQKLEVDTRDDKLYSAGRVWDDGTGLACSVNHLTHIGVISIMIQGMDDPGRESQGPSLVLS